MKESVPKYPILKYIYHKEAGSSKNLLFLLPGLGINSDKVDHVIRTQKGPLNLKYDSITASFIEAKKKFSTYQLVEESTLALKQAQKTYGFKNVLLFGSSIGAGYAVRMVQEFKKKDTIPYNIMGLILLSPCVNKDNLKPYMKLIEVLSKLPQSLSVYFVQAVYEVRKIIGRLSHDPSQVSGSILTRYLSLLTIPERSNDPVDYKIPVYVFSSKNDLYINYHKVNEDLSAIFPNGIIKSVDVQASGINGHNLLPCELKTLVDEQFLPILSQIWNVNKVRP